MKPVNHVILHIPDSFRGKCNGSHIRWKDHIGDTWDMEYKGQNYPITVVDVVSRKHITFQYNAKRVTITHVSMSNKLYEQELNGSCNAGKLFYLINDNGVLGDTGHNAWVQFNYSVGDVVKYNDNEFTVLDIHTSRNKWNYIEKQYLVHCHKCSGDVLMNESSLDNHAGCPCCLNRIVIKGINDIATTDSWAIPYFKNPEDVQRYHSNTWFTTDFICPKCGRIFKNVVISQFFKNTYHLNCPCGSGYKSYPERFIYNVFLQLGVTLYSQLTKADFSWCGQWRYDFYHKITNTIIEVNGLQHYSQGFDKENSWSNRDERLNDMQKRQNAIDHGVANYIELDCRKSNKDWMQSAILNSDLPRIFMFSNEDVDWNRCDIDSRSNLEQQVCEAYQSNVDVTLQQLADQFGVKRNTIYMYLKHGSSCGLCNYDAMSLREKINEKKTSAIHLMIRDNIVYGVFTSWEALADYSKGSQFPTVSVNLVKRAENIGISVRGYTFVKLSNFQCYSDWLKFKASCDFVFA